MGTSDLSLAEKEYTNARKLMSLGRMVDAEAFLIKAEGLIITKEEKGMLMEIILSEANVHICLGQVPKAIRDVDMATNILKGSYDQEHEARLLFQKGLVHLCAGREEEAHSYLTKYIDISERSDRPEQLARGHFYLALVYEGHGEPCMAVAELEQGRSIAKELGLPLMNARSTAFMAHLLIRSGQITEAIPLENEALQLVQKIPYEKGTSKLGMTLLVDSELHTLMSEQGISKETFQRSIESFRCSCLKCYFEAFANACYGETLLNLGMEEGRSNLQRSLSLFEALGNSSQVEKVMKLLNKT